MPLAVLRIPSHDVHVEKLIHTPSRINNTQQWLKGALRALHSSTVQVFPPSDWEILDEGATIDRLAFHLRHRQDGTEAFLTIYRRTAMMGAQPSK